MKKFLTFILGATLVASSFAQSDIPSHKAILERLDSCEAILQEFQGNARLAIPADVLRRARGIIITNQFKASFFLGIKDGYGVMLVRRPNGKWSVPAFLKAGDVSLGFQVGGQALNTVMVILDDETPRRLFRGRVNFGSEAKVVAGIRSAESEMVTQNLPSGTNVLVYSNQEGLIAGVALKTGFISPDERVNDAFYKTKHKLPELLYSDWVQPPEEARFLMNYVEQLTR